MNWYWIELIGFDNKSKDYGVNDFIKRAGKNIDGISLLLASIDFINGHNNDDNYKLKKYCSTYGGHDFSEERKYQIWTNFQLKMLVKELQSHNIKVVFASFNIFYHIDGVDYKSDFSFMHKELWSLDKDGVLTSHFNVLKRMNDGKYYSDYFTQKLKCVIDYFNFDGFQLADGLSSFRHSILNGDFSDEMVDQFSNFANIRLTESKYIERRKEIIENYYIEWIKFTSSCWEKFYKKVRKALSSKLFIANCAWTSDPFEALYRYGIDYRSVFKNVDYIMFEDVSPTMPIYSYSDSGNVKMTDDFINFSHNKYFIAQSETRIVSDIPQLTMTSIRDTYEQWDILRHAPMELVKSIIQRNCMYIRNAKNLKRVSNGEFYCLSDSFKQNDWEFIYKNCQYGKITNSQYQGIAIFKGYKKLIEEVNEYDKTKKYSSHELIVQLSNAGLTMGEFVDINGLKFCKLPLLVTNPRFLDEEELEIINNYKGEVIIVSSKNDLKLIKKCAVIKESDNLFIGASVFIDLESEILNNNIENMSNDDYGAIWTSKLKYYEVKPNIFRELALKINKLFKFPYCIKNIDGVAFVKAQVCNSYLYLYIFNPTRQYLISSINVFSDIITVESIIKYKGYNINFNGEILEDRIPPRGVDILKLSIEGLK